MRGVALAVRAIWLSAAPAGGAPIVVRHLEGVVHGFLVLRTLDGALIARGDLIQRPRGNQLSTRVVFHFKDGSLHDETATFTQRGQFRLIRDRLIQKGPSFPHPIDVSIDGVTGETTVRYWDDHGEHMDVHHVDVPTDLANGILTTLLKNVRPDDLPTTLSLLAVTPKPRLVKLQIEAGPEDSFAIAGGARKAAHYVVKPKIGGFAGLVAPIVGKQPPDSHVWILRGEAPAFVKSEAPLYFGGPIWRIELTSPTWPKQSSSAN
jgi:hypothetical protein